MRRMDEHEIVRIYEKLIVAKHTKHLVGYGVRIAKYEPNCNRDTETLSNR